MSDKKIEPETPWPAPPDPIHLLPSEDEGPAPLDIQQIDRWVRRLGELQKQKARVKEVLTARMKSLESQIVYATDQIDLMALRWRGETGLTEPPLTAGTVKVRQRSPTVYADAASLMEVAKARGVAADPEFISPPKPTRAAILKLLKWQRPEADSFGGKVSVAFDPESGIEYPGIIKTWPAEGEWSVSIKPGEIVPLEEGDDDAEA